MEEEIKKVQAKFLNANWQHFDGVENKSNGPTARLAKEVFELIGEGAFDEAEALAKTDKVILKIWKEAKV